jgi:hypothetical protein
MSLEDMMQIDVPPSLSAWLAEKISTFNTDATPDRVWLAECVAAANALPLYEGWFDTIGLRPNGEVVQWSTEGEYLGIKRVEDRCFFLNSLVHATERHQELCLLLPSRPPTARDCDHLAIRGMVEKKLFCSRCCGLGWVDAV